MWDFFVFCRKLENECSSSAKANQQLEKASSDLEASLGELEASRIANMLLKQQVSMSVLMRKILTSLNDMLQLQVESIIWSPAILFSGLIWYTFST